MTDTNSVSAATIMMVDGAPVVEWSPKLSAEEAARRRYTILRQVIAWRGRGMALADKRARPVLYGRGGDAVAI